MISRKEWSFAEILVVIMTLLVFVGVVYLSLDSHFNFQSNQQEKINKHEIGREPEYKHKASPDEEKFPLDQNVDGISPKETPSDPVGTVVPPAQSSSEATDRGR